MFLHEKEPGYKATHDTKDVSSHDLCRKLSAHDNWSQLAVHVALDMVVVIEDLSKTPHSLVFVLSYQAVFVYQWFVGCILRFEEVLLLVSSLRLSS